MDYLEAKGVAGSTMQDIAEGAGSSRKTIYRYFSDRTSLLSSIRDYMLEGMRSHLAEFIARFDTLEEALVEGSIEAIRIASDNRLFIELVHALADEGSSQFDSQMSRDATLVYWKPLLERARLSGELDTPIPDDQVINWLRMVQSSILLSGHRNPDHVRATVRTFLIPSVFRRPPLEIGN